MIISFQRCWWSNQLTNWLDEIHFSEQFQLQLIFFVLDCTRNFCPLINQLIFYSQLSLICSYSLDQLKKLINSLEKIKYLTKSKVLVLDNTFLQWISSWKNLRYRSLPEIWWSMNCAIWLGERILKLNSINKIFQDIVFSLDNTELEGLLF